jgi:hypothetical protein
MTSFQWISLLQAILLLHLVSPHHVVFEEIGKMAGALSYVHAIVPVNISSLAHAVHAFRHDVHVLKKLYIEKRQPSGFTHDDWFHQRIVDLFQLADVDAMLVNIDSLRYTLPAVATEMHLPLDTHEYQI